MAIQPVRHASEPGVKAPREEASKERQNVHVVPSPPLLAAASLLRKLNAVRGMACAR
eukprot:CAMPEP_0113727642 /NCGR_PEP_ID=MMETSP0038_2-20120614/41304_1 /TAXON_ID=2898 /ORGANISM="Cryptomonas paramecium" /LENGTH=56 /DNA_ID=CAMNT_0000658789 /DNA_START=1198 /DNA_END=1364 /DNA_ORIENTATION=- /assembly_acc=CAM_ASM_000170